MQRALAIGLTLLASAGLLAGIRFRSPQLRVQRSAAIAAAPADETKASAPIPQDEVAITKRRRDLLAWNRRTLHDAYDQVGKKDPRWDELARKALDLGARLFSEEVDPQITFNDVYPIASAAVEAGCDDPMVAYLHARTAVGANHPGPEEFLRRARAAAQGLVASRYPPFRRAVALRLSSSAALYDNHPANADRKQAETDLDAALALLKESAASDERNAFWEKLWLYTLVELTRGYRTLGVPAEAAYERVDAGLARAPGAEVLRLLYRGRFWSGYGWKLEPMRLLQKSPRGASSCWRSASRSPVRPSRTPGSSSPEQARRRLAFWRSRSRPAAIVPRWNSGLNAP